LIDLHVGFKIDKFNCILKWEHVGFKIDIFSGIFEMGICGL